MPSFNYKKYGCTAHVPFARTALLLASIAGVSLSQVTSAVGAPTVESYFKPEPKAGERYADIFSKADSIKGQGFNEIVRRISGTSVMKVLAPSPGHPALTMQSRYDGTPEQTFQVDVREGGTIICFDGKCGINSDTSATWFNPLLWGMPRKELRPGLEWIVDINKAWEIGPPGTETVRVMSVDSVNHVVMLSRVGKGEGFSTDDLERPSRSITIHGKVGNALVKPGPSSWSGQIIIQNGIVMSDEILLERHVTLVSELGTFEGEERVYTLFNAMPIVPPS